MTKREIVDLSDLAYNAGKAETALRRIQGGPPCGDGPWCTCSPEAHEQMHQWSAEQTIRGTSAEPPAGPSSTSNQSQEGRE